MRAPRSAIRLIDATGTGLGTVRTVPAARAAVADPNHPAVTYAIRLRADLLAADIDLDGQAGDTATDALAAWCDRRGIAYLIAASGRAGHHHLIARPGTSAAAFRTQMIRLGITSQIRGGAALLRPVGAPSHRPGAPASRLIHPATPAAAIAALTDVHPLPAIAQEPCPKTRPVASSPAPRVVRPHRGLPAEVAALAFDGIARTERDCKPDGTLDDSHTIWVLGVHAHWAGWTRAEFLAAATDPAHLGCGKAIRVPGYAQRMWDRTAAWVADHTQPTARPDLTPILAAAWAAAVGYATEHLPAQTRPPMLATYAALLGVAARAASTAGFGVSIRRLAEDAALTGRDTAHTHLGRWIAAGLLEKVQTYGTDGTETNRYALPETITAGGVVGEGCALPVPPGHDTWTAAGLGKAAWLAYGALSDTPQSLEDLAVATARTPAGGHLTRQAARSLDDTLAVLAEQGLAVLGPTGWTRGTETLTAVADDLGAIGQVAALAAQHTAERAARRAGLADATLVEPSEDVVTDEGIALTAEDAAFLDTLRAEWAALEAAQQAERRPPALSSAPWGDACVPALTR